MLHMIGWRDSAITDIQRVPAGDLCRLLQKVISLG